jgi:hypothetical protein
MHNRKLTIAIVGLGFGSMFAPIYAAHPDGECCLKMPRVW